MKTTPHRTSLDAIVTGTAEQPVFAVARRLADGLLAADWTGGPPSLSGNPDVRPGRWVEAHARFAVTTDEPPPWPLVMPGECDVVVGMEPLEALRVASAHWTPTLAVLSLVESIPPTPVTHQGEAYPDLDQAVATLQASGVVVELLDPGTTEDQLVDRALVLLKEAQHRNA